MRIPRQRITAISLVIIGILLIATFFSLKMDFEAQGAFLCDAVAANPDIEMSQCPVHKGHTMTYIMIGFVLSFAVLIAGTYLWFATVEATKPATPKKKIDTSKLSPEEKKIYNLVKAGDGSMYQSDLIKETGYSKVKMTRYLDKLEGKGLIERKRRGMTNIVLLK